MRVYLNNPTPILPINTYKWNNSLKTKRGVLKMAEQRDDSFDTIIYILACLVTLGTVWILRIVITKAINLSKLK